MSNPNKLWRWLLAGCLILSIASCDVLTGSGNDDDDDDEGSPETETFVDTSLGTSSLEETACAEIPKLEEATDNGKKRFVIFLPFTNFESISTDYQRGIELAWDQAVEAGTIDESHYELVFEDIVDVGTSNDSTLRQDFFGTPPTIDQDTASPCFGLVTQSGRRGAYDDPNVIGVVVATTDSATVVASNSEKQDILAVVISGTGSRLQGLENLVRMAPGNQVQAQRMYDRMNSEAQDANALKQFTVFTEPTQYASDLTSWMIGQSLPIDLLVQETQGVTPATATEASEREAIYYAQMASLFPIYDEGLNDMTHDDELLPLVAGSASNGMYFGFTDGFVDLFDRIQTYNTAATAAGSSTIDIDRWLTADGVFSTEISKFDSFKQDDTTLVASLSSLSLGRRDSEFSGTAAYEEAYDGAYSTTPTPFSDYGYDAGSFVVTVISDISGDVTRASVLSTSQTSSYSGLTGTKSYSIQENPSYELTLTKLNAIDTSSFSGTPALTLADYEILTTDNRTADFESRSSFRQALKAIEPDMSTDDQNVFVGQLDEVAGRGWYDVWVLSLDDTGSLTWGEGPVTTTKD